MDGAVQVQFGLKKFFIYFVISAGLGLFVNSLVQKYVSGMWKDWQSQLTEKNISGSPPTIVFSRYGWPVIGADIASATHRTSFQCYGVVTEVQDVFVPLPLYQLISRQLRFGTIDVSRMKIELQEDPACVESNTGVTKPHANLAAGMAPPPVDAHELAGSLSHPEWFATLERWFSSQQEIASRFPVPRMRVREITLDGSTLSGKALVAKGEADFSYQDGLKLNVRFNPISFKKRERSITTNFTANLLADSKQVQLHADWAYDEGHLLLGLNYQNASHVADVTLGTRDLPLSVLNRWFDTPWAFQFLWFNCGLHLASTQDTWASTPWDISDCKLSGPHGNIKVLSSVVHSIKTPQDLAFQIYDLDLDNVIKGKSNVPLDGVLKSFGVVEGRAQVNQGDISSHLTVKNAQIIFSRRNQRKLQVIDEMKLEVGYARNIYSLLINSAKIHDGVFDGFIALDYNKHLKRSSGKMSVSALQFSPEIQDVMWGGRFSPFLLSGDVALDEEFRVELAKLNLSFKSFASQGLTLANGAILMEWRPDGGSLSTSLAQLKVNRDGGFPWLFAPFLDEGMNRDAMVISRIYSQGHFEKSHLVLDKVVGNAANQRLEITGDVTKRSASGEWAWGGAGRDYRWKWIYADQRFTLIPLTSAVKEWLKMNDSYLEEYPFIRMENSDI